jgi:hypothetical protein
LRDQVDLHCLLNIPRPANRKVIQPQRTAYSAARLGCGKSGRAQPPRALRRATGRR